MRKNVLLVNIANNVGLTHFVVNTFQTFFPLSIPMNEHGGMKEEKSSYFLSMLWYRGTNFKMFLYNKISPTYWFSALTSKNSLKAPTHINTHHPLKILLYFHGWMLYFTRTFDSKILIHSFLEREVIFLVNIDL